MIAGHEKTPYRRCQRRSSSSKLAIYSRVIESNLSLHPQNPLGGQSPSEQHGEVNPSIHGTFPALAIPLLLLSKSISIGKKFSLITSWEGEQGKIIIVFLRFPQLHFCQTEA
jgi:hypothetical protein